jgi:enoyl-CoA hydratase/carnithine racemase
VTVPDPDPTARVIVSDQDHVRTLILNRPAKRNALDDPSRETLLEEVRRAERDASVRAVVVTGAGPAFCAGGDIASMSDRLAAPADTVAETGWRRQLRTHALVRELHDLSKPTVAAVNGVATGLGADLALACDFVIAAESARIAMSYVLRGLIPDGGAVYFLPRRVGLARAKELILTGRTLGATEALSIGLVDEVVPDTELHARAREFLRPIVRNSALAVSLAKDLLDRSSESDIDSVFASTRAAQAMCYTSAEHRTAVTAFTNRSRG